MDHLKAKIGDRVKVIRDIESPSHDFGIGRGDFEKLIIGPTFIARLPITDSHSAGVYCEGMSGGHNNTGGPCYWWWPGDLVELYDPDGNY